MRIAVVGGGPGGLFFATLIKQADCSVEVTVFERKRPDDTFGFGVVFSDRTLGIIEQADPSLSAAMAAQCRHWDAIEVRIKGERIRCRGNGMAAIVRRALLAVIQDRAREVGAELRFSTYATLEDVAGYDLVVAADGTGSAIRESLKVDLGVETHTASAKFIWFGTDYLFDGLTFVHQDSPDGVFAVHGYPISDSVSTFIVETDENSWRRAGLDKFDTAQPPGPSDLVSKDYLQTLFADQIDGKQLLINNSRWGNFRTRRTQRWHTVEPRPIALLGDAVHTAHFSVGSGTKMAMEDAIALSQALTKYPDDLTAALAAYEAAAQPAVRKIQDSARPSLAWWEHFGLYHSVLEPWPFAYHFLSRSITEARLAKRDPEFVGAAHRSWVKHNGAEPLDTPFDHRGWRTAHRLVKVAAPNGTPLSVEGLPLNGPVGPGPWGIAVAAPDSEANLPVVDERLAALVTSSNPPIVVAVFGGTALTRTLVCERARMHYRVPALLVIPPGDDASIRDQAVTALLSQRADLVGVPM